MSSNLQTQSGLALITNRRRHSPAFVHLQQSSPVTITYVYDDLHRLKEANYSNGDYYHYTYDAVGNRLSQTTSLSGMVSTITYNYDHANRLIDVDGVLYVYDNNGNLTNDGVNAYTYDSANWLKTFSNATTTANYMYNGLGDRLQETVNGVTTTFTMDLNTGLTQALSDGTNTYIYGLGRIAQVNTSTEYFLGDALGSVRQMVNAGGTVTYAKAYDPYGVVRSTSGTSSTAYGYTGEFTSNDMVYLRARHYAPGMGRFITTDPSKLEANRYLYAKANPVNRIDPAGLFSRETIEKNIPFMGFAAKPGNWRDHSHWGFYLLLRNAENWDSVRVGYADLLRDIPDVTWRTPQYIRVINCDQILVGSQPLAQYYENVVKRRSVRGMWWRDSTPMYYELKRGDLSPMLAVDGTDNNTTSYPDFKGLSLGVLFGELNLMVDVDGNKYLAISSGWGYVVGIGYTEGYLCNGRSCPTKSPAEIEQAITGWCLGVEGLIFTGINLGLICNGYIPNPLKWSQVYTYYLGAEAGYGAGITLTLPLSRFGVAPEPARGWRWALINQQNGVTYNTVVTWEGRP